METSLRATAMVACIFDITVSSRPYAEGSETSLRRDIRKREKTGGRLTRTVFQLMKSGLIKSHRGRRKQQSRTREGDSPRPAFVAVPP
jgi:hypothetical protein